MPKERPVEIDKSALLLVDIQPDFLPGGALPVPDGEAILEPVGRLMEAFYFQLMVATQDWHPRNHISFASQHEGREPLETVDYYGHEQTLWPDHCVQGAAGGQLHPDLPWDNCAAIIRKGMQSDADSYSGFRNNWNPQGERPTTGLKGYLQEFDIERLFIAGLAREVCALWTAGDAAKAGFETCFLWDLTRPVDPQTDENTEEILAKDGVRIIDSAQVPGDFQ